MKLIFTIFFILNLFSYAQETTTATANIADPLDINNSFITKFEYGKMLFNNPRGIGCNSCHGDNAKGQKLMDFKQEHDKKIYNCSLFAPNIKDIEYETFSTKVNSKKNPNLKFEKEQVCDKLLHYANVMPTYFLVEEEIEAIFYYIKNLK